MIADGLTGDRARGDSARNDSARNDRAHGGRAAGGAATGDDSAAHAAAGPLVLGIESSCDETGVGIVRGRTLLTNTIASSMEGMK